MNLNPGKPNNKNQGPVKRLIKEAKQLSEESTAKELNEPGAIEHMQGVVGEFLDGYAIIGYDIHGNAVSIVGIKNHQQADALSLLLQRVSVQLMQSETEP